MTVDDAGDGDGRLHRLPRRRLHRARADQRGHDGAGAVRRREITAYLGGRDDAFFNDLPGFFRSINYAPQFYKVPQARQDLASCRSRRRCSSSRATPCSTSTRGSPTTARGSKLDLPHGPLTWDGDAFAKDADGNYRFVYSGEDAQAGRNVNAIILEVPLAFLTEHPEQDRMVNVWGESWVRKAAAKIETIPDDPLWTGEPGRPAAPPAVWTTSSPVQAGRHRRPAVRRRRR